MDRQTDGLKPSIGGQTDGLRLSMDRQTVAVNRGQTDWGLLSEDRQTDAVYWRTDRRLSCLSHCALVASKQPITVICKCFCKSESWISWYYQWTHLINIVLLWPAWPSLSEGPCLGWRTEGWAGFHRRGQSFQTPRGQETSHPEPSRGWPAVRKLGQYPLDCNPYLDD